jgi:hypothetical protein
MKINLFEMDGGKKEKKNFFQSDDHMTFICSTRDLDMLPYSRSVNLIG